MNELVPFIQSCGGVTNYRTLDAFDIPRAAIAMAVRQGSVVRVRERWFALPDAEQAVVRAVRVGGTLTGASVARLHKLWILSDDRLHVRVAGTAGRLAAPGDRTVRLDADRHNVCVHYSRRGGLGRSVDALPDALIEMFRCGDARAAVVAADSALNSNRLQAETLREMRPHIPATKLHAFDQIDGSADSGLESLVRLLLVSRRVGFRAQVRIDGVGRVDILIGDRLVLELDGEAFHTGVAFEEDRRRDFELVMQGYLVLRISYRMIMGQWDEIARGILDLVRRDEHLWKRSGARRDASFAG